MPVAHKDGIWILDPEVYEGIQEQIGKDFAQALQLKQAVVDFEITPNRPDCLAQIGMAREAAATFDRSFEYPDIALAEEGEESSSDYVDVEIRNTKVLAKKYAAGAVVNALFSIRVAEFGMVTDVIDVRPVLRTVLVPSA